MVFKVAYKIEYHYITYNTRYDNSLHYSVPQ